MIRRRTAELLSLMFVRTWGSAFLVAVRSRVCKLRNTRSVHMAQKRGPRLVQPNGTLFAPGIMSGGSDWNDPPSCRENSLNGT